MKTVRKHHTSSCIEPWMMYFQRNLLRMPTFCTLFYAAMSFCLNVWQKNWRVHKIANDFVLFAHNLRRQCRMQNEHLSATIRHHQTCLKHYQNRFDKVIVRQIGSLLNEYHFLLLLSAIVWNRRAWKEIKSVVWRQNGMQEE